MAILQRGGLTEIFCYLVAVEVHLDVTQMTIMMKTSHYSSSTNPAAWCRGHYSSALLWSVHQPGDLSPVAA